MGTALEALHAHFIISAWWRDCTPDEQDAEDWRSGNTGLRPKTWWSYKVFYFAPNQADVAEGAELLREGLQRLRMAGDWGVSAAASLTAGPGATSSGLGQIPEGSPATEGLAPPGTAPAHGITQGPWRHFNPSARSRELWALSQPLTGDWSNYQPTQAGAPP